MVRRSSACMYDFEYGFKLSLAFVWDIRTVAHESVGEYDWFQVHMKYRRRCSIGTPLFAVQIMSSVRFDVHYLYHMTCQRPVEVSFITQRRKLVNMSNFRDGRQNTFSMASHDGFYKKRDWETFFVSKYQKKHFLLDLGEHYSLGV